MIKKRYGGREIRIAAACTVIIIFSLSIYIWHQTESISIGYTTSGLEEEVLRLEKEIEQLETIRSSLLSLDRVERIAREELGLKNPKDNQIIWDDLDGKNP